MDMCITERGRVNKNHHYLSFKILQGAWTLSIYTSWSEVLNKGLGEDAWLGFFWVQLGLKGTVSPNFLNYLMIWNNIWVFLVTSVGLKFLCSLVIFQF